MKRYFIIAILLMGCTAWAQQKTTFVLQKDYELLMVNAGWSVRLIQVADYNHLLEMRIYEEPDTLDRIVVYADGEVKASKVFSLKDGVLTLKKNTSFPQGTRVEVYTAQRLKRVELKPRAELSTDRFEGYADLTIAQWERSRLVADTLASPSILLGFNGDSCYFDCRMIQADNIVSDEDQGNCYGRIPIERTGCEQSIRLPYLPTFYSVSRLMPVWDEAPDVRFNEDCFSLHFGLGARLLFNRADNEVFNDKNAAYFNKRVNLSATFYGKWKLDRRWDIKAGLQVDGYYTPFYPNGDNLFEKVGYDEWFNTHDSTLISRYLWGYFLGIPMSVTYHPNYLKPEALGISLGIVPSIQFLSITYFHTKGSYAIGDDLVSNPFRLEARIGVESNVLGIIHGLQFFVNLLPVYVGVPDANRYREFGIGIAF